MRSLVAMTYERWDRLAEWPLVAAASVFFLLYASRVIGRPEGVTQTMIEAGLLVIWVVFVVDFVVRLILAPDRWRWLLRHLHLLAIVVLPFFRTLFVLRLVALLSALRRATASAFRGRVMLYSITSASLIVLVGDLGVLDAEQDAPGATITSFGDSIWWAFTTITTVGYGDLYPVTIPGRTIAVGLMISGIALVGAVTATLASWFVERVQIARGDERAAPLDAAHERPPSS